MKKLGYGKEYKYAHDFEGGWLPEIYLPGELAGALFYDPKTAGWEAEFVDQLRQRRAKVKELMNKKDSSRA
jgi:putative ATPase